MPRWKAKEEAYLIEHAGEGAEAIAEALGRSTWSVRCKASELGVSLLKRYLCPKCGKHSLNPLSKRTGWCRRCSVEHSADNAAVKNRELREQVAKMEAATREEERRRQMIYSDTNRQKKKLRRFNEVRQTNDKSKKRRRK